MEKLEYKKEDVYQLEVNDKGDYIEIDLLDIDLPDKILNAHKQIEKEEKNVKIQERIIYKKYANNPIKKWEELHKLEKNYFTKMRKLFDSFLGEGACLKIFGTTDRYGMFSDLLKALQPHFDNMKIDIDRIKKELVEEYKPNNKKVI